MRIAVVHTRLLHRGGLETRLFSYLKWLRDAGHDVTAVVYRVGRGVQAPEGVHIHKIALPLVSKVRKQYRFSARLKNYLDRENFDFVLSLGRTYSHDVVLLPGNHLGYLRALGQVPSGLSDRLQIELDQKAYAAPGTILACSQMMKDEVVDLYGADPAKINVLFPPTDTTRFHIGMKARQAELKVKFGMDPNKRSFVLVSASHSRKGLPLLLQAFRRMQDSPVELLVAGGENVRSDLPNVRGLGFVRETEELFAAADGMVLPAIYEPYGQVVSESILCGTPVLVSDRVGAKEVVTDNVGKILPLDSVEAWREELEKFTPEKFLIPTHFAKQHQLDLNSHMKQILRLAK